MTGWTQERVDRCVEMFLDGASMREIADELGGLTRNAVIGKVYRMGLSRSGKNRGGESPAARQRFVRQLKAIEREDRMKAQAKVKSPLRRSQSATDEQNEDLATPQPPEPKGEPVTLLELSNDDCRWPVSDVDGPDTLFCGAKAELGGPYCGHHMAKATGKQPQGRTKPVRTRA